MPRKQKSSLLSSIDEERQPLDTEKEVFEDQAALVEKAKYEKRKKILLNILSWTLAIWGFMSLSYNLFHIFVPLDPAEDVYRPETLPLGLSDCDCGTTMEEAMERKCVYDTLATSWLPPRCRDDSLTAEFDRSGPGPDGQWDYYLDENGTISLTKGDIAKLGPEGGSFWSSRDWHIAHCVFYWQKYKRMGNTNAIMEARYDSLHHVEHCSRLILNPKPSYFFLIEVPVKMGGKVEKNAKATKISGMLSGHEHEQEHPDGHEMEVGHDHGDHED